MPCRCICVYLFIIFQLFQTLRPWPYRNSLKAVRSSSGCLDDFGVWRFSPHPSLFLSLLCLLSWSRVRNIRVCCVSSVACCNSVITSEHLLSLLLRRRSAKRPRIRSTCSSDSSSCLRSAAYLVSRRGISRNLSMLCAVLTNWLHYPGNSENRILELETLYRSPQVLMTCQSPFTNPS